MAERGEDHLDELLPLAVHVGEGRGDEDLHGGPGAMDGDVAERRLGPLAGLAGELEVIPGLPQRLLVERPRDVFEHFDGADAAREVPLAQQGEDRRDGEWPDVPEGVPRRSVLQTDGVPEHGHQGWDRRGVAYGAERVQRDPGMTPSVEIVHEVAGVLFESIDGGRPGACEGEREICFTV